MNTVITQSKLTRSRKQCPISEVRNSLLPNFKPKSETFLTILYEESSECISSAKDKETNLIQRSVKKKT